MEPMTTMALISAGSSVLGKAATTAPAGPSSAYSGGNSTDMVFDNSGWTVATGKAEAEGATSGFSLPAWAIVGIAFLAAVAWIQTRR